jgi:mono/diheme cytochrome c family protein
MGLAKNLILISVVAIGAGVWFVRSGIYDVAADTPHWGATHATLASLRDRSIEVRAAGIALPDLSDSALIRSGAGNYDSMCVVCHLRPGAEETELSRGLYPRPPSWRDLGAVDPREAFWTIKHGVKMTGMPAWGRSMDDRYIWGMVAFIRRLPEIDEAKYTAMVAESPGHSHGGGESDTRAGDDAQQHDANRSSFEPVEDPMASGEDKDHQDAPDEHTH